MCSSSWALRVQRAPQAYPATSLGKLHELQPTHLQVTDPSPHTFSWQVALTASLEKKGNGGWGGGAGEYPAQDHSGGSGCSAFQTTPWPQSGVANGILDPVAGRVGGLTPGVPPTKLPALHGLSSSGTVGEQERNSLSPRGASVMRLAVGPPGYRPRGRQSPAGPARAESPPFLSIFWAGVLINHLHGEPEPRRQRRRGLAPSCENAFLHMLSQQGCASPYSTCELVGKRCLSSRHVQPCLGEGT